jgi:hypothetical protein
MSKKAEFLLNAVSFTRFLQGEESRYYHIHIQFSACRFRDKSQSIVIESSMDYLNEWHYDSLTNAREYLDG